MERNCRDSPQGDFCSFFSGVLCGSWNCTEDILVKSLQFSTSAKCFPLQVLKIAYKLLSQVWQPLQQSSLENTLGWFFCLVLFFWGGVCACARARACVFKQTPALLVNIWVLKTKHSNTHLYYQHPGRQRQV